MDLRSIEFGRKELKIGFRSFKALRPTYILYGYMDPQGSESLDVVGPNQASHDLFKSAWGVLGTERLKVRNPYP